MILQGQRDISTLPIWRFVFTIVYLLTWNNSDYILLNGQIVYQITYVYSDSQNEFIDDWKFISPDNQPISKITNWVKTHLSDFTGAVNVQYRDDKIISIQQ